jgi:hypothetical protein
MKGIFSLLVLFVLFSCGNNKADEPATTKDSATVMAADYFIWQSTLNDSTGKLELVAVEPLPPDSLQLNQVVERINRTNVETNFTSKVRLVFIKSSGDTAYLKIPDATYLTQQMGSTGPRLFLSGLVYTLTSLPGINYVNLDFEEGDHAAPGTYSRESFKDE